MTDNTEPTMLRGEDLRRVIDDELGAEYKELKAGGAKNKWYEIAVGQAYKVKTLESRLSKLEAEREKELREFVDWLAVSGYLTGRETLPSLVTAFLKQSKEGK